MINEKQIALEEKNQRSQWKSLQTRKCLGLWFFTNGISLIMLCLMHLIWNFPLLQIFPVLIIYITPDLRNPWSTFWLHGDHFKAPCPPGSTGAMMFTPAVQLFPPSWSTPILVIVIQKKRNVIPSITSVGRSLLLVASIPIIPLSQPYAVSFHF